MNVARFFQQTAVLKGKSSVNDYGEDVYGPSSTISVRWFYENHLIRDSEGEEVTSGAHISTLTPISNQDVVVDEDGRDREVISVRKNRDVGGSFSHFVAYLK